jgi:hypothetical protein
MLACNRLKALSPFLRLATQKKSGLFRELDLG